MTTRPPQSTDSVASNVRASGPTASIASLRMATPPLRWIAHCSSIVSTVALVKSTSHRPGMASLTIISHYPSLRGRDSCAIRHRFVTPSSGATVVMTYPEDPIVSTAPEQTGGFWATLREAVRGSRIDYTTAPIGRAVIMLAVPMVMEMAMESIFAVVDVFWVAHLGANAVATVGLTESMLTIIYTAAMGLSIGATALVARRTGEHDAAGAARVAGQAVVLGVIVSTLIAVIAAPRAEALLALMGATPEVIHNGSGFTRVMMGGNVTVVLLFLV